MGDDDEFPRHADGPEDGATLRHSPPSLGGGAFAITVEGGADRGARLLVTDEAAGRLLVGTSPTCELRLTDRQVSRRHLALGMDGDALVVTDLESMNGTWLRGVRVREIVVHDDVELRVGETTLRARRQRVPVTASADDAKNFGGIWGESRALRRLFPLFRRLAGATVPVIIEGETGTGKEVLAEALHEEGPRKGRPFIVFDCTAVPPTLVESELFGHERGAFTGAVATRKGVFEQADGGTLLIDEIGDLETSLQPKLLRALERSEVRRVGGERWLPVDVRVLVATRRDLDREIQAGRFRDDLFHRLAVARVELPPLRKRGGDIPLLVAHFCEELGGDPAKIPAHVLAAWQSAAWPGNVRELRNVVARHIALGELAELATRELDADVAPGDWLEEILSAKLPLVDAREKVLARFERLYIERTLEHTEGNVARAAAHAGIARRYFQILRSKRAR